MIICKRHQGGGCAAVWEWHKNVMIYYGLHLSRAIVWPIMVPEKYGEAVFIERWRFIVHPVPVVCPFVHKHLGCNVHRYLISVWRISQLSSCPTFVYNARNSWTLRRRGLVGVHFRLPTIYFNDRYNKLCITNQSLNNKMV